MQSPSTSVASTAVLPSNSPAQPVRREIWPVAVITLGATVAWVCLLGYGLIESVWLVLMTIQSGQYRHQNAADKLPLYSAAIIVLLILAGTYVW
jgi:uncharacterized SAM-binding protein YcdF (DUF218 family)